MPSPDSRLRQAVAELYIDHHTWLSHWLRRQCGNAEQAADLTQDTFARILATRTGLGLPPLRTPRAFLTTVAKGLLIDHFRRADLERAWLRDAALRVNDEQSSPEAHYLIVETLHAIDRMLDGLPPKARIAWLMNKLDGATHADIATHLGVSVPRVRQYLAMAAKRAYAARYGIAADSLP